MNTHNTKKKASGQSIVVQNQEQDGKIVPFWKTPGETLAIMLRRFREEQRLTADDKLTYAGRLDPMAEGIVPILVGEARFQKDHMIKASKTYEVDIVLGLGTDTGDLLGLATPNPALIFARSDLAEIEKALEMLKKTVSLPYPNYSSRPVEGKPLFMHARAGNAVVLPIKKVMIYSLELLHIKTVPLKQLLEEAIEIIQKVQGDFRQREIIQQWESLIKSHSVASTASSQDTVQVVTIRCTVSSGTYMRALAEKMGLLLKVPALASKIVRINIQGI